MDLCGVVLGWGGGDMAWGAIWTSKVGTCMNALYICSFIYVLVFMFFFVLSSIISIDIL